MRRRRRVHLSPSVVLAACEDGASRNGDACAPRATHRSRERVPENPPLSQKLKVSRLPQSVTSTAITSSRGFPSGGPSDERSMCQTYTTGRMDHRRSTMEGSLVPAELPMPSTTDNAHVAPATHNLQTSIRRYVGKADGMVGACGGEVT